MRYEPPVEPERTTWGAVRVVALRAPAATSYRQRPEAGRVRVLVRGQGGTVALTLLFMFVAAPIALAAGRSSLAGLATVLAVLGVAALVFVGIELRTAIDAGDDGLVLRPPFAWAGRTRRIPREAIRAITIEPPPHPQVEPYAVLAQLEGEAVRVVVTETASQAARVADVLRARLRLDAASPP